MSSVVNDNTGTTYTCFSEFSSPDEIRTEWILNGTLLNETDFVYEVTTITLFLDDTRFVSLGEREEKLHDHGSTI